EICRNHSLSAALHRIYPSSSIIEISSLRSRGSRWKRCDSANTRFTSDSETPWFTTKKNPCAAQASPIDAAACSCPRGPPVSPRSTTTMPARPGGYDADVFQGAEDAASLLLADIDSRYGMRRWERSASAIVGFK